jgi:hypothetical protein
LTVKPSKHIRLLQHAEVKQAVVDKVLQDGCL